MLYVGAVQFLLTEIWHFRRNQLLSIQTSQFAFNTTKLPSENMWTVLLPNISIAVKKCILYELAQTHQSKCNVQLITC